ncbi:MAG: hypothetical protein ABF293_08070 [Flavobacteriaceae bacterium]
MTEDVPAKKQKDIEGLYSDVHKWVSEIHFVRDEIVFIKKLLNSDVFEPNTPNLFERIQEYIGLLESFEKELNAYRTKLLRYESELGTLIECGEPDLTDLERKHLEAVVELDAVIGKFQMLKSEIFEYSSGILRKKRR